jgi:hypothetical protein
MQQGDLPILLPLSPSVFFPGSIVTTPFGWDATSFPGRPRIHPAVDRAGKGIVRSPLAAKKAVWIDNDAEGCSVLRLFFDGGELRLLHFIREELDSGALAAGIAGAPLELGAPIGPAGNHGLSVSTKGGDGRHVHCSLILEPKVYDSVLAARIGSIWASDYSKDYRAQYGAAFSAQAAQRGIEWMNAYIIARHDPYYSGSIRYFVNPVIFGL